MLVLSHCPLFWVLAASWEPPPLPAHTTARENTSLPSGVEKSSKRGRFYKCHWLGPFSPSATTRNTAIFTLELARK